MSNIIKFAGGGYTLPLTYYQPVFVNDANARRLAQQQQAAKLATSKSSTKKKEDDDFFSDKNFMDMLGKINGLPSDMQQIFSAVQQFYSMKTLGVDSDPGLIATRYIQTMSKVKEAYFNKQQYDHAYQKLLKEDALNEKAINLDGSLVARNKDGELKTITMDTYKKNREDYQLLTNSELLEMRAYNLPFQNSLFNVTNNGIGLPQVNKLIKDAIQNLGSFTTSENVYTQRKAQNMIDGIEAIQKAAYQGQINPEAGVDGLYDVSVVTENQVQQCKQAINYILNVLPDNAKTLLALRFPDGNPQDYVYKVITDAVTASQKGSQTISRKLILDENNEKPGSKKKGSTTKSDDPEDVTPNDLLQNIIENVGGSDSTYTMQDKNGNYYSISGTSYPDLSINTSTPIPAETSLQSLLNTYHLSGILDNQSQFAITFGDQILSSDKLKDVVYLNDARAIRAILPVKVNDDPNTKYDHRYVPDLDFMDKHKELITKINQYGFDSIEVKNEMINAGLVDRETGELNTSIFKPYLMVNGLATENQISNDNHANQLFGDDRDRYMQIYKNGVYVAKGNEGKDYKSDVSDGWFFSDKLYSGTIFLPVTGNVLQGKIAAGTNIRQSRADQLQEDYQRSQKQRNMNSTSASDL